MRSPVSDSRSLGSPDLNTAAMVQRAPIKYPLESLTNMYELALIPCVVMKGILWPRMEHKLLLALAAVMEYKLKPLLVLLLPNLLASKGQYLWQWWLPHKSSGDYPQLGEGQFWWKRDRVICGRRWALADIRMCCAPHEDLATTNLCRCIDDVDLVE